MLASLSPARRRFVIALGGLVVAGAVIASVALVGSRDRAVVPASQSGLGPVLLVPGYGGSTTVLGPLANAVRQTGRDVAVVALADDATGDLRDQAQTLNRAAEAAIAESDATSVDVVGFSAGGVVARLWVADFGGASLARRIITLGSPQHGTDLAALAGDLTPDSCPVACQQLAEDSDLLRQLNADDESPDGPLWVSIWTTSDQVVVPPQSAELDGALNVSVQSVCVGATVEHGDLPRDPRVIAMTLHELGTAPPSQPPTAVC